jgi:hypothetical protein
MEALFEIITTLTPKCSFNASLEKILFQRTVYSLCWRMGSFGEDLWHPIAS